jgi:(p)ppGpp synthase/HD superfamily hydrolase
MSSPASSPVARARDLALLAHGSQQYGDQPYRVHLEAVQSVLTRFGVDDETILAAAWLHDALEDNRSVSRLDLEQALPEAVVAIVDACTDGEGESRDERKKRSLRLIPQTHNAVVVKLADRIANVEASSRDGDQSRLAMYRKEHGTFCRALRSSPSDGAAAATMWAHLDQLLA